MNDSSSHSRTNRVWVTLIYLLLLLLIIPWYWPEDDVRQLAGIPLWALVSLGVLLLTSTFTAWLCLRDDEPEE